MTLNGSEPLPPDGRFGRVDHAPVPGLRHLGLRGVRPTVPTEMSITLDLVLDKGDADDPGPVSAR